MSYAPTIMMALAVLSLGISEARSSDLPADDICYGWVDTANDVDSVQRRNLSLKILSEFRIPYFVQEMLIDDSFQDYGKWEGVGFIVPFACSAAGKLLHKVVLHESVQNTEFRKLLERGAVSLQSSNSPHIASQYLFPPPVLVLKIPSLKESFNFRAGDRYTVNDCLVTLRFLQSNKEIAPAAAIGVAMQELGLPTLSFTGVGKTYFVLFYDRCEWKINMISDALALAESGTLLRDIPRVEVLDYGWNASGTAFVVQPKR